MTILSYEQVAKLALDSGLSAASAAIAVAVAKGESGFNTAARGDVGLQTSKWGPSIGLWQVRSLKAEKGTGGTRDENALLDPTFNAKSMVSISSGGTNWHPWTVYNTGAYLIYYTKARAAIADVSGGAQVPTIAAEGGGSGSGISDIFGGTTEYVGSAISKIGWYTLATISVLVGVLMLARQSETVGNLVEAGTAMATRGISSRAAAAKAAI